MGKPLRTIMFVEDDPDIQAVAQLALEAVGGYMVELFSSGLAALDAAMRGAPDLVILDVMMPGMDGPATFAALRHQAGMAGVPVIFMTARVQRDEVDEYLALGAVGVIAKPFDPMRLAATVAAIWERIPVDDGNDEPITGA